MLRSRLFNHSEKILREDMLTLFSHTVKIDQLEVSVLIDGSRLAETDIKYRAASLITLLTGERPTLKKLHNVEWEMDLCPMISERGIGENPADKRREAIRNGTYYDKTLTSRKPTEGSKLVSTLHRVPLWEFLEKLRQFYLPDQSANADWEIPPNELTRKTICSFFQVPTQSKKTCYPPRQHLRSTANPHSAMATYKLLSSDTLKFPDIEVSFEALGNILSNNAVSIYLRPFLKVETPLKKAEQQVWGNSKIDRLKIMNWYLSQFFNPMITRMRSDPADIPNGPVKFICRP